MCFCLYCLVHRLFVSPCAVCETSAHDTARNTATAAVMITQPQPKLFNCVRMGSAINNAYECCRDSLDSETTYPRMLYLVTSKVQCQMVQQQYRW